MGELSEVRCPDDDEKWTVEKQRDEVERERERENRGGENRYFEVIEDRLSHRG